MCVHACVHVRRSSPHPGPAAPQGKGKKQPRSLFSPTTDESVSCAELPALPRSETGGFSYPTVKEGGDKVEAEIAIFPSETKELNEVSDTWHRAPCT